MPSPRPDAPPWAWSCPLGLPPAPGGAKITPDVRDDGPVLGLPVGGLGAGAVVRTLAGDFAGWALDPGFFDYRAEDGWTPRIAADWGAGRRAATLATRGGSADAPPLPPGAGRFAALFPFQWHAFEPPGWPLRIASRQFSPVLPHNYRETSFPVGVIEWTVENVGASPADVTLTFPITNVRPGGAPRGRVVDVAPGARGALLGRAGSAETLLVCAAPEAGTTGTVEARADGAAGAAVVRFTVAPRARAGAVQLVAWDLPEAVFGAGRGAGRAWGAEATGRLERWRRRYASFFPVERAAGESAAVPLAAEALERRAAWAAEIERWHAAWDDPALPPRYRAARWNELYVLPLSTAWCDVPTSGQADPYPGRHKFFSMECFDYVCAETLDVRLYASFPLLLFWPEIERDVVRAFAREVHREDDGLLDLVARPARVKRLVAGAVPHDLGSPEEAPWTRSNTYRLEDPNEWRDLGCVFALVCWRALRLGGADEAFLREVLPAAEAAVAHVGRFDRDGDGIPENSGVPDQTFDVWSMEGVSAYCGGLWIAAQAALAEMCAAAGRADDAARHRAAAERARARLDEVLWRGTDWRYCERGDFAEARMTAQMMGEWHAALLDLPVRLDPAKVDRALTTVLDRNVRGVGGGRFGAVNGTLPDGSVDPRALQSAECWPGVSYALASHLVLAGRAAEGMEVAEATARATTDLGYAFRTPEAWDIEGRFRALYYQRPLAIWAVEAARIHGRRRERGRDMSARPIS